MSIDPLSASRAYGQTLNKIIQSANASEGTAEGDAKEGVNFTDALNAYVKDAVDVGRNSETEIVSSLANKSELVDVVTAITAAEVTLETVVAVRDKVIEAYESIMRMPI